MRPRSGAGRRRGLAAAALAAAWCWCASAPAALAPPAPGEVMTLDAIRQQWIQDRLWCGQGEVHVTYQDLSLRCDEVEVDTTTMHLHAEGNVILDQGQTRMACDRIDFDLRAKVGTMVHVDAFFPPTYHFRGDTVEKLSEDRYRFHHGLFTSCDLSDRAPPWSIQVQDAVVQLDGYGHFRGVALMVRGVPVFYTPRLLWPVKRDRAAGFLPPTIGFSSQKGAYLGNSFFWPISRSFDTTLFLDLYTKSYVGVGQEMRWAPAENALGDMADLFVWDPIGKRWEWKADGRYNQLFPGGYALHAQLQELSDIDFFQHFEGASVQTGFRTLFSFFNLAHTWGPQALTFRADHQRAFFTDALGNTSEVTLSRLGEIEYRLRSTRIGKTALYVSANGLVDELQVDRPGSVSGRYGRLDAFPSISLLAPGFAWLSVTPTIGARETYYTAQYSSDRRSLLDEPLSRHYGTAGISIVGPSFSRIWTEADGDKVKHLIEPRLDYTYVSNPGGNLASPATSPIPLFDERDSVVVANEVTWTLANRLFVKSGPVGSREVASLEISQPYSLSTPLTLPIPVYDPTTGHTTTLPGSQRGPLDFWLRLLPTTTATIDARADLSPVTNRLQTTSLTGGFTSGLSGINLTWFTGYDPGTGKVISSQTGVFYALGPARGPWRLESHIAYDVHLKQLLEQRYVFRWRGSCWSTTVELRDYRIAPYQTRDYRISIDLTGLGTFLDIKGALDSFSR